ncbi:MAG: hypothetical protein DRP54_06685 [Spirochaetes bacterium]|nr:MAG: hypothetical protein DRP54_06685 [Spirochaetota bacterium]
MQYLDTIDINRYKELVLYDRWEEPVRTFPESAQGMISTTTSGSVAEYDVVIMKMSGFPMESAFSRYYIPPIEVEKRLEALWMNLIGIFESGDPDFAINHDEIYGRK